MAGMLAAIGAVSPANAIYGVGGDFYGAVFCTAGRMQMANPTIWAIPATDSISSRRQLVAWAVTVWYSSDLVTWGQTNAVPYWHAGYVNDRYYALVYNIQWFNAETQTWEMGNAPSWDLFSKGYYAAVMQMIWYADDQSVLTMETAQLEAFNTSINGSDGPMPYCTQV
jgi:hypothetical protein